MEKINPKEALERLLEEQKNGDIETAHYVADNILIGLLRYYSCPEEVIEAWNKVPKWYA